MNGVTSGPKTFGPSKPEQGARVECHPDVKDIANWGTLLLWRRMPWMLGMSIRTFHCGSYTV